MNLTSKRLLLQETDWDDLSIIHALHCESRVEEFNTIGIPGNPEMTRAIIAGPIEDRLNRTRSKFEWTIRLKKNEKEVLGTVGLSLAAPRFRGGEIHYSLFPDFWGQGYGFEGVKAVLKFGFKQLDLHRIHAGVAVTNTRSINLLEKVGMQREGRGRQILPLRGEWVDNYWYAILEDEF
jgi:RimJ/RimL family protein N-acetyltransferase